MNKERTSSIPYFWLFLSGAIALTYEVLWIHYFRLLLGNTVYSFSWTTGIFLLGLSLGTLSSYHYLKRSPRNILKTYAFLELLITIFTALSFLILMNPPHFITEFLSPHSALKDGLCALIFIFPITAIMGATFPLLTETFGRSYSIEKMYGINTIGGGIGILLFGFFAIATWGYQNTLWPVLALNFLLAIWVFQQSDQFEQDKSELSINETPKLPYSLSAVALLSGFILLGLEVVWFKTLEIIFNDRAYVSTLVLFIVLLTLGVMSWLTPRLVKKSFTPLLFVIPLAILFFIFGEQISDQAFLVARGHPRISFIKSFYIILTFLCPLAFLGLTFPSLLNMKKWTGMETAQLLLLNTLGGIIGTISVSYFVIENLGMKSFYLISAVALLIILLCLPSNKLKKYSLITTVALILFLGMNLERKISIHDESNIIVSNETPYGLFSLIRRNQRLEIYSGNYRIVAPYGSDNVTHAQNGLAYYPALFLERTKHILSMGTGYGISLGAFLSLSPNKVTAVEILKAVNDVSHYFKEDNRSWFQDPKIDAIIDDARGFLKRSSDKYDLISSNIASPYTTAGSLFLTKQYFQEALEHLTEDGVYSQLVWGPHLTEIIHTFSSVFPHIKAIPGYEESDLIIIGSKKPLTLKKNIHLFDQDWPLYRSKYSREETFELGEKILKENLAKKPEFIIDDHRASLTHNWDRGLRFLWIHGH